jgi:hypothetical protein
MESDKKVFIIGEIKCKDDNYYSETSYRTPNRPRTFKIDKITKCFIFWIELDTNCWNNNHKIFKKKKKFCKERNCEYFEDNTWGLIFANDTYV